MARLAKLITGESTPIFRKKVRIPIVPVILPPVVGGEAFSLELMMQGDLAGTILGDGELVLGELLGQGAMGAVYRAHQTSLDRVVAVKVLLGVTDESDYGHRLVDEARAAAKIRHSRLVEVIDVGEDSALGPYVIYEYLPGCTFEEYLEKTGKLDWDDTFDLAGRGLLEALEAIHAAGVIHRDVKPANLLANGNGDYLLSDLGLAIFEGRSSKTKTGSFFGTPGYLSPERMSPKFGDVTAACDIYAAAVVMVRSMIGRLPFEGKKTMDILRDQLERDLTPEYLVKLGIPRKVAPHLSWALVRSPKERCQSARELLKLLKSTSDGHPVLQKKESTTEETKVVSSPAKTQPVRRARTRAASSSERPLPQSRDDRAHVIAAPMKKTGKGKGDNRYSVLAAMLIACLVIACVAISYGSRRPGIAKNKVETSLALMREDLIKHHPSCPPKSVAKFGQAIRKSMSGKDSSAINASDDVLGLYELVNWCIGQNKPKMAWTYAQQLLKRNNPQLADKAEVVIDKVVKLGSKNKKWSELDELLRQFNESNVGIRAYNISIMGRLRAKLALAKKHYRNKNLRFETKDFLPHLRRIISIGGKDELPALELFSQVLAVNQSGNGKNEYIDYISPIASRTDLSLAQKAQITMIGAQRLILCWPVFAADLKVAKNWAYRAIDQASSKDQRAELRARAVCVILETPLTLHWDDKGLQKREASINEAFELITKALEEAEKTSTKALVDLNYAWVLRYKGELKNALRLLIEVDPKMLPHDQRWWYWRIRYAIAYEAKKSGFRKYIDKAYEEAPVEYLSNLDDIHKPK